MDTITPGRPASSPPVLPAAPPIQPLQSEDFDFPDNATSTAPNSLLAPQFGPGSTGNLNASDRIKLHTALGLLKAARNDANSKDPKLAKVGRVRVGIVVSYLTGFFDSRGLLNAVPLNAGYEGLMGTGARLRPDLALDELEASLVATLVETDTRGVVKSVVHALGEVYISFGTGLVVLSMGV